MQTFLTAVLLATAALAAPTDKTYTPPSQPSCVERAGKVDHWEVNNFYYHASYIFSTPSHQIPAGYVSFTLTNPALDYKPICTAESDQLQDFFYGTQTYTCKNPSSTIGDVTTFTFDRPTGKLHIEQTWNCVKEGGRFTAKGGTKFDLKCDTKSYQNPDWQEGETYSSKFITCKKVSQKANVTEISGVL